MKKMNINITRVTFDYEIDFQNAIHSVQSRYNGVGVLNVYN